jgi:hypothetical protein
VVALQVAEAAAFALHFKSGKRQVRWKKKNHIFYFGFCYIIRVTRLGEFSPLGECLLWQVL